jgi:ribonuclease G
MVTMLTESCPTCDGAGYVKSRYTVSYEVLRHLRAACRKGEGTQFDVHLSPEVARLLIEEEKSSLEYLETTYGAKINVVANSTLIVDNFEVKSVH